MTRFNAFGEKFWITKTSEFLDALANMPPQSVMLARYVVVEYDRDTDEIGIQKNMICPASAEIKDGVISWRVNDCDMLSDPLIFKTRPADTKFRDGMLGYWADTDEIDGRRLIVLGTVTAVCIVDMTIPFDPISISAYRKGDSVEIRDHSNTVRDIAIAESLTSIIAKKAKE